MAESIAELWRSSRDRYRYAWQSAGRRAKNLLDERDQARAGREGVYRERAQLLAHLAAIHESHIAYTDPDVPTWPVHRRVPDRADVLAHQPHRPRPLRPRHLG